MCKLNWAKLPYHIQDKLLYLISKWRLEEKLTEEQIAKRIPVWIEKHALDHYKKGMKVHHTTIGRRFREAIERNYVLLGRYSEQHLADQIKDKIGEGFDATTIYVAPDRSDMLRYVWLDLDKALIDMVKNQQRDQVVVGVSGGHTMLEFANIARSISSLEWHDEISAPARKKVVICSLTSGGIRSDIAALSDTVAANIAGYLDATASGLLGPAWFEDKKALNAFRNDTDVKKHIKLAKNADIILTSIGYIGDPNSLMRELLDHENESKFIESNPNLADMLYNCYDGIKGNQIKLPPKVADGLFSVVTLEALKTYAKQDKRCIIMASGKEKGQHALRGILEQRLARHIYMDHECAEALLETFK